MRVRPLLNARCLLLSVVCINRTRNPFLYDPILPLLVTTIHSLHGTWRNGVVDAFLHHILDTVYQWLSILLCLRK